MSSRTVRVVAFATIAMFVTIGGRGYAQERMNDDDVQRTMRNLKEDSQRFQSTFNSAISKSSIRKTTEEKNAKNLVKSFRDQVETMLNVFQDKKKADTTIPGVLTTAKQIDGLLAAHNLGTDTTTDWARCKSEMRLLAKAFNMPAD